MEQDPYLSPFKTEELVYLIEKYSTPEKLIIKNFIQPFIKYLQSKGIDQLKSFSRLLIKYSLQENKPNNAPYYGKMNKDDFCNLLRYLFERIGRQDLIKIRCFKRIDYKFKDILFAFIALECPDVMYQIANSYFIEFKFHLKLYKKQKVSEEWKSYVNELQKATHHSINSVCEMPVRDPALNFNQNVCPGQSIPIEDSFSSDQDCFNDLFMMNTY